MLLGNERSVHVIRPARELGGKIDLAVEMAQYQTVTIVSLPFGSPNWNVAIAVLGRIGRA